MKKREGRERQRERERETTEGSSGTALSGEEGDRLLAEGVDALLALSAATTSSTRQARVFSSIRGKKKEKRDRNGQGTHSCRRRCPCHRRSHRSLPSRRETWRRAPPLLLSERRTKCDEKEKRWRGKRTWRAASSPFVTIRPITSPFGVYACVLSLSQFFPRLFPFFSPLLAFSIFSSSLGSLPLVSPTLFSWPSFAVCLPPFFRPFFPTTFSIAFLDPSFLPRL